GAKVEDRLGAGRTELADGPPPPIAVDIHRQQVVHPIIFRRDLSEHFPDACVGFVDDRRHASQLSEAFLAPLTPLTARHYNTLTDPPASDAGASAWGAAGGHLTVFTALL